MKLEKKEMLKYSLYTIKNNTLYNYSLYTINENGL